MQEDVKHRQFVHCAKRSTGSVVERGRMLTTAPLLVNDVSVNKQIHLRAMSSTNAYVMNSDMGGATRRGPSFKSNCQNRPKSTTVTCFTAVRNTGSCTERFKTFNGWSGREHMSDPPVRVTKFILIITLLTNGEYGRRSHFYWFCILPCRPQNDGYFHV
jgi:hypothetical protein